MLKTLRRRIVLMLLAAMLAMMGAITIGVYTVSSVKLASRQNAALDRVTRLPISAFGDTVTEPVSEGATPFFAVRFGPDLRVLASFSRMPALTEEQTIELARIALARERTSGVLAAHALRYTVRTDKLGNLRVTAISTAEDARQLRNILLSTLTVCAVTAAVAFVLCILPLSRRLIRPVAEAWAQQKRFIADASHELKTPLSVILANLAILKRQRSDGSGRWLENTEAEALRMQRLIDEMLELARAESAQVQLALAETDLADLFGELVMVMEPLAFDQGAVLSSEIEPGLRAVCDGEKLRHAVQILLDNAIRYAAGSKAILLSAHREGKEIVISVAGEGEPIPAEVRAHLFERFYRADDARATSGYGLGLAIAKSLVERHHGRIECLSDDTGNRFVIRIPLRPNSCQNRAFIV